MEQLLLAYIFVCFSVGLMCMGITIVVAHRTRSSIARSFLAFYVALTLIVLASLILAFLDIQPELAGPRLRGALEYLEAIVGFYGVMLTLPLFVHRVFQMRDRGRDRLLMLTVGVALIVQHVTEFGLGDRWDEFGDLLENLLFSAIIVYSLTLGLLRRNAPGVDRTLGRRLLVLGAIGLPVMLHDLFLMEATGLRFYPLGYSVFSGVIAWTLYRRAGTAPGRTPPLEWDLSEREAEVAMLISRGLSNKEIASALHISPNTVKTHVRAVFDKSGCRSRFALMSAIVSEHPDAGSPTRNPTQG